MEKEEEKKRTIHVELTPQEYEAIKKYANKNNLKTKTYTEFILKSIVREAENDKTDTFLSKLRKFF